MIQLVDDGYHIVRLSGPVIILFSNSNSFYKTCYVYFNRLWPTYATRRLHVEFFLLKYILLQPLDLLAFSYTPFTLPTGVEPV